MVNPEIRTLIEKMAAAHNLDPDYVEAHVMKESSGNPQLTRFEPRFYSYYILPLNLKDQNEARERATSFGLMQIMGQTARELGFKGKFAELLAPECGLEWGCKKLKKCYDKYRGDINKGIAAYNCGTPRVKNGKLVNQEYVDKVNGFLKQIKEA